MSCTPVLLFEGTNWTLNNTIILLFVLNGKNLVKTADNSYPNKQQIIIQPNKLEFQIEKI